MTSYDSVRQGQRIATLVATWDAPLDKNGKPQADVVAYQAQWKRSDNEWINLPQTGLRNVEVAGIFKGDYLVRVRAINSGGASSLWATSMLTHLTGRQGEVPKPVGLSATEDVVFGINVTWAFPADSGDTLSTELQYSVTSDGASPMLLADVPYPQKLYQQMGLKAGQIFWYRARLVDRIGNQSEWTEWVRGQASIDVSDVTEAILEEMQQTDLLKDMIQSAVDTSEKISGMAQDIQQNAEDLEQQAQQIKENADGLSAAETKIDDMRVSIDGMSGGVKNSAIAIIQGNLAQVTSRRSQTAKNASTSASIDRVDTTIADASRAVAQALVTLDAQAGGNVSNATDLTETLADFTQASATKINSLSVTVNGQTAAITQNAEAVADISGNLNAMYSIKVAVDSNGVQYAAGMGIGVQNTPS
ncbi:phage tail tip fiber protein, partial [Franconibacter pulveris]|uniref:phage tail tip fiber protein n=1 Tax=Franconibacter pulveris TaxID=435910 RepID=UPI001F372D15